MQKLHGFVWRNIELDLHTAATEKARTEAAVKLQLLRVELSYAETVDVEWGCSHDKEQITQGLCPRNRVEDAQSLLTLAVCYRDRDGYDDRWRRLLLRWS